MKRISTTVQSAKRVKITDFFSTKSSSNPADKVAEKRLEPASSNETPESIKLVEPANLKHDQSLVTAKDTWEEFNKEEWIQSLTDHQRDLLELEISTIDISWLSILHKELTKPYFLELKQFLSSEYQRGTTVFPPKNDIYSWTRLAPLSKVKVLVVGQDPYHNHNQAHGLAFSVRDPKTRVPPSLQNIYKCIKIDYPDFCIPQKGDLTSWTVQGVLLLNTCLTVRAHNANSHAKRGWEQFTKAAIQNLIKYTEQHNRGIVILAWGSPAQKLIGSMKLRPNTHLVLQSVHPSPLSASRGFFKGQHFIKCNEWLREKYNDEIVWRIDSDRT